MQHFDLIIIGGGSGGIATAVRASSHGATCAVVENSHLGGTCVNLGCVPKKVMWNASSIAEHIEKASFYGIDVNVKAFDWGKLVANREAYINRLRGLYSKRLKDLNITHLQGFGSFQDNHTILVNNQAYTADHIVIATGGEPIIPDLPGIEHSIDSDGFFALTQQPKRVAVIGSGYIGVELAGVLRNLGSEVYLILRHGLPLRRFDTMLGEVLLDCMEIQKLEVLKNTQATAIKKTQDNNLHLQLQDGVIEDLDAIIWAVGREPRIEHLNLDSIGIETTDEGMIATDE